MLLSTHWPRSIPACHNALMSQEQITISRPLVGVLTLVCFAAALVIWLTNPAEEMWLAGFVRVGLVMGALWLALPSRTRPAAWANVSPGMFVLIIVGVLLLPRYPRLLIPLFIVLLVVGFVLRPRRKRSS